LFYLSLKNTYAETAMEELKDEHRIDAPTGTQFLNRVKKLFGIPSGEQQKQLDYFQRMVVQTKIWEKLTAVNDELVAIAVNSGLFKKPVICAMDYTKIPYYGIFNSNIVRSKHDRVRVVLRVRLDKRRGKRKKNLHLHCPNHASFFPNKNVKF
jgi:hypothetical protein